MRNPYRPTTHTILPALRQTKYSFGDLVTSLMEFVTSLRAQAQKEADSPEAGEAAKSVVKDAQSLLDAVEPLTKALDEDRLFDLLVAFHAVSRLSRVPSFNKQLDEMMVKRAEIARAGASLQSKERKQDQRQICFETWEQNSWWLDKSVKAMADFIDPKNKEKKRNSQLEKDIREWRREWDAGARA
jgi:hypothetical protein